MGGGHNEFELVKGKRNDRYWCLPAYGAVFNINLEGHRCHQRKYSVHFFARVK